MFWLLRLRSSGEAWVRKGRRRRLDGFGESAMGGGYGLTGRYVPGC